MKCRTLFKGYKTGDILYKNSPWRKSIHKSKILQEKVIPAVVIAAYRSIYGKSLARRSSRNEVKFPLFIPKSCNTA